MIFFLCILVVFLQVEVAYSADYDFPRIVWSFWVGNIFEDIAEMVATQRKYFANFTYNFLTDSNVSSFVVHFPSGYDILSPVNKADFVRLALVERYGGFWIDASVYVCSDDGLEYFFTRAVEIEAQLTGTNHNDQKLHPCSVASYFFGAPKNSVFIKLWLAEFERAIDLGLDEYGKTISKEFPDITPSIHYAVDVVETAVEKRNCEICRNITTFYEDHNHKYSPFRYAFECSLSCRCIKRWLRYEVNKKNYAFIKMDHKCRSGKALHSHKEKKHYIFEFIVIVCFVLLTFTIFLKKKKKKE